MRKVWLWLGGLVVLAGVAAALLLYPSMRFRSALDGLVHLLPAGYSVTYESASYSILSGKAMVSGLTVRAPQEQQVEATIGELDLEKPNLDFAARWAAVSAGKPPPDEAIPVASAVAAKHVRVQIGSEKTSVNDLRVEGLRLYPAALLQPGLPSPAEIPQAFNAARQAAQLADIMPLLRFEAALALSIGYDRHVVDELDVSTDLPVTAKVPVLNIAYSIRRIEGKGTERGAMEGGFAENVTAYLTPLGAATVERVGIGKVNARPMLEKILSGAPLEPGLLDGLQLEALNYAGIVFRPANAPPMSLGNVALSKLGFRQGLPVTAAFAIDGLKLAREQVAKSQAAALFEMLGLESATLRFGFAYEWDTSDGRMTIHDTVLKVDELGRLELAADLADVSPATLGQGEARLAHAKLHYDDASLTERLLRMNAAKQGVDLETLRGRLVAQGEQEAAAMANNPAMATATRAMAAFLRSPHSVQVEVAPPRPLPLAMMRNLDALSEEQFFNTFGFSVTTLP